MVECSSSVTWLACLLKNSELQDFMQMIVPVVDQAERPIYSYN